MRINNIPVENTFAEAFPMTATRVIITARDKKWLKHATDSVTGFATSVIACGVEAGVEDEVEPANTLDGRVGVSVLFFTMSGEKLERQIRNRIGQCVLTSPTSAVYSGLYEGKTVPLGKALRYFGDGYQISKKFGERRFWRIPVMEGEFICEDTTCRISAIGGGNFLIVAQHVDAALEAAERAVEAIASVKEVITPFPGGVVRSGSKVGSKYQGLLASTNHTYCPTLRGVVESRLPDNAGAVLEIVIDGLSETAISQAMKVGITAACSTSGLLLITASNFGGKLGKYQFQLHEVMK